MLSVSLAVICDYGVGSSWLRGSLSYLEGLIVFNPLDGLQPNLHTGGQLMPTEPNRQSIIISNKGHLLEIIYFLLHLRIYPWLQAKVKLLYMEKRPRVFANAAYLFIHSFIHSHKYVFEGQKLANVDLVLPTRE